MKLQFRLKIRSDYHVGAGHGDGEWIDSALLKDVDGVEVIRGSTLAGLLREGLRCLCQTGAIERDKISLCNPAVGLKGEWCSSSELCPVCRIFGSPVHAKDWLISSARPSDQPVILANRPQLARTRAGSRSTIDLVTGRSEAGKLFNEEEGGHNEFEFSVIQSHVRVQHASRDAALMFAAARMVREFGKSRRRGRGECFIELVPEHSDLSSGQLLSIFKNQWLGHQKHESCDEPAEDVRAAPWKHTPTVSGTSTIRCQVIVQLEEPAIVGAQRQSGNQIYSAGLIPGSTLLGAFAGRALRNWTIEDRDVRDAFYRIFRRGGVKFPFLHPCNYLSNAQCIRPSIPWPLDLMTCQMHSWFAPGLVDRHSASNYATQSQLPLDCLECNSEGKPGVPLKPDYGYLTLNSPPRSLTTAFREEMHVQIDPQSKSAKQGQLYGYTAIEAGQFFFGEMEFATAGDLQSFRQLCSPDSESVIDSGDRFESTFELRLGRAIRRGYGRAIVHLKEVDSDTSESLNCRSIDQRITDIDAPVSMLFLSDTILTDDWGRTADLTDHKFLGSLLKLPSSADVDVISAFTETTSIGAFSAHLGLPRWPDIAWKSGTTVGFKISRWPGDLQTMQQHFEQLEKRGVGMRIQEGFGKVCFNHPFSQFGNAAEMTPEIPDHLVQLPEVMQQYDGHPDNALNYWASGCKRQIKTLHSRWMAVARWLHSRHDSAPQVVLTEFRELRESLKNGTVNLPIGDLEHRDDKGSKFKDEDLGKIETALNQLTEKEDLQQKSMKAIRLLADLIAEKSAASN